MTFSCYIKGYESRRRKPRTRNYDSGKFESGALALCCRLGRLLPTGGVPLLLKQFFRRTVLYQKVVNCKRNKKCDIINGDKCRGCRFDKCLIEGMDPLLIKIDDINCRNEFIEMLEKRRNKLQQTKSNDLYHQEDQKTICVKNNKNFDEYKQSTSNQDICISNELCFNDTTIVFTCFSKT
uniref:Nuclear receptor domain-containing protein n=1 Tax=Meloidogyne incognita TaxID=6306 RepID=A0A914MT76_MELIC